ncbi:hypothetical protein HanIR_Chr02g0074361 [Helianthus annuus]|nr:hypothetical protein HanIR_Chr02g0074361 [Helianthus annuus]
MRESYQSVISVCSTIAGHAPGYVIGATRWVIWLKIVGSGFLSSRSSSHSNRRGNNLNRIGEIKRGAFSVVMRVILRGIALSLIRMLAKTTILGITTMGTMVGTGQVEEYLLLVLGEARNDGNVETGTSSLNDLFVFVLFDSGADWGYVSLGFSHQLGLTSTPLVDKHVVGFTGRKSHVLFCCKLDLMGQVFDIELLLDTFVSFTWSLTWTWLSMYQAEILCKEKIVRIPLSSGEFLSIQDHRSGAIVTIVLVVKAHKCLQKGYPAILALATDSQP